MHLRWESDWSGVSIKKRSYTCLAAGPTLFLPSEKRAGGRESVEEETLSQGTGVKRPAEDGWASWQVLGHSAQQWALFACPAPGSHFLLGC